MSTPAPPGPTTVTPRFDGDCIVLTLGDISPFGAAEVAIAGDGVLIFDPAAPDRLIEVRIDEPEYAEATLTAAMGATAARQLAAMGASGEVAGPILLEPSTALTSLGRLALVSWLEQWTPLDIPGQALLLDLGTQAHAASHPLLAVRSFASSADYLVAIAEHSRATDLPSPIAHGISHALAAASSTLKNGHPLSARIAELARTWATSAAHPEGNGRLPTVPADEPRSPLGGDDERPGAPFSVDWALVPSRVLHAGEGRARLSLGALGPRVTVEPARWLDVSATQGLRVRLVDPASGRTLADAPLLWDALAEAFAADFPVGDWSAVDPDALRGGLPEVYAQSMDGLSPHPRMGAARDSARAWRDCVRALTWHRQSHASEVALGERSAALDRQAAAAASAAALTLEALGGSHATTAAAIRAWMGMIDGTASHAGWPSGMAVPGTPGQDRPTLAELVLAAAPELFEWAETTTERRASRPTASQATERVEPLRLAWTQSSPFGEATTELPGSVRLTVDPAAPGAVLGVAAGVLDDRSRASLVALFGPAAEALIASALERGEPGLPGSSRPQAGAAGLCRLAFVRWYSRFSPAAVRADDLQIDLATAAYAAAERAEATALFEAHVGRLIEIASILAGPGSIGQRAALKESVTAAVQCLAPSDDRRRLQDILATIEHQDAIEAERLIAAIDDFVAGSRLVMLGSEARGSGTTVPNRVLSRKDSVDWTLVPRGVLSPDEGAVRWGVDGDWLVCRVLPHPAFGTAGSTQPGDPDAAGLVVRYIDRPSGRLVAQTALTWKAALDSFEARLPMAQVSDAGDLDGLFASPGSLSIDEWPATGDEAVRREARRHAVRSLVIERLRYTRGTLGRVAPEEATSAIEAQRALSCYQALGADADLRLVTAWADSLGHSGGGNPVLSTAHTAGLEVPDQDVAVARPLLCETVLADRMQDSG